jgi:hypothetical protein
LHHALRELSKLEPTLGANADFVEQARGALTALTDGAAEYPRKVHEQFLGGQVVVEIRVLGKVANPAAHGDVADGAAQDLGVTRGRINQLHQQLQGGGLASPVGAEEAEDGPSSD